MIRNLIFDFGGVLIDWNPRYLYASYFQSKEEMELFLRRVGFDQWNAKLDGGYPLNQGVTELCRKFPEYDEPIHLFRDEWEKTVKGPMPGMSGLLDRLKANGYKLFGLTNWSNETFPIARRKYPLFERLDGIVVSGAEKICKPDPRIYHILLDRYQLSAAETLFIDDTQANIDAACKIGFSVIHFSGYDALLKELERFQIKL